MGKYVDVILPVPINASFTYATRKDDKVSVGERVIVPFGKKKIYTGIVWRIKDTTPEDVANIKEIYSVVDSTPIIYQQQHKFWEWMASYYLCPLGDIYKAAIPSGMKLESETYVALSSEYNGGQRLSPKEETIYNSLSVNREQTLSQIEKATGEKYILNAVKTLIDKGVIVVRESVQSKYHPLLKAQISFTESYQTVSSIKSLINQVQRGRSEQQYKLLMTYLDMIHFDDNKPQIIGIDKKDLLKETSASSAVISAMIKKGIFEISYQQLNRLSTDCKERHEPNSLNDNQQTAFDSIHEIFNKKNVCLLNGVTSSGKTEIYIHLIKEKLAKGKQVLYLLPEIALTTQITSRLQKIFGNDLGVYHSRFSDAERVEIWQKQLSTNPYKIILGVRSSIFLPYSNLGLIIIDEEHENSYKQYDPSPRYHARDSAIILASIYKAKTLLGTATPSIESYNNAMTGKYGYVELNSRYRDIQLPRIIPVDMKELRHKRRNIGSFSPLLIEEMRNALNRGEQIILFQNRRGYAPIVECHECGWIPKCKNCDVSLTYHKRLNKLTCHYCGYTMDVPAECPSCHNRDIRPRGMGTEKIEDEVFSLFPDKKVVRMDLDTTRTSKNAYEKIINSFEELKTDILIGTQMISKGLDFDNVSVVGILDADSLLNFPDFRAHERAFQLMSQVAGRAGRKGKQGIVILQTRTPDDTIIKQVIDNNYSGMYNQQIIERKLFHYPPFHHIIYVYLKHHDEHTLDRSAQVIAGWLRHSFGNRILGPDKPPIGRIQSLYIRRIVLKIETHASMQQAANILQQIKQSIAADKSFGSLLMYFDVDPQ